MKNEVKIPVYMVLGITTSIILSLFIILITLPVETQADVGQLNFTVGNAAPTVGTVTCGHPTLAEVTDYAAVCYATLTDTNGYQDILTCNGSFYKTTAGLAGSEDKNVRYGNSTCILYGGSGNDVTCNCTFYMKYYADGGVEWSGKLMAIDGTGETGTATGTVNLESNKAIMLPVGNVLWGTLTVNTPYAFNAGNITRANNTGNVNVTLAVQAASGTMTCAPSPANVNCNQIKVLNATGAYASGLALSEGAQNLQLAGMDNMWLDNVNDDAPYTLDNRTAYWAINVPTGVNGTCTITINQLAADALAGT